MRTQPRLRQFIPFLAIAALLACAGTDALAQETRKETPAAGKDGPATAPSPAYDLEIKDGLLFWNGAKRKDNASQVPANLQNVVDLLRELHPEANFALSPKMVDTVIGDMKMRTSSAEEKLEAIRIASGLEVHWHKANSPGINPQTSLPASPNLYVLEAPAKAKAGLQVEAFNIGGYVNSLDEKVFRDGDERARRNAEKREQIVQMVIETVKEFETVSQVANPKSKSLRTPSIKFHPGANLIVIIGEPEAVAVAAKVIGALPGAQRSVTARAGGGGTFGDPVANELTERTRPDGNRPAARN